MGWQSRSKADRYRPGPGTIAVISGGSIRFAAMVQCLSRVERPAGTVVEHVAGSINVAGNRNIAIQAMQGDWLWLLDDDAVFAPDCLLRLLAHFANPDVNIVVPHVYRREYPGRHVLSGPPATPGTVPVPLTLDPAATGLIPVYAAGTAGMLIRRRVFTTLSEPWFEVGRYGGADLNEDLAFCAKAQVAGFTVWADLDTTQGHIAPVAVWPQRTAHGWRTALQFLVGGDTGSQLRATEAIAHGRQP